MPSTRRDLSGVFDTELRGQRVRKAAILDESFHIDQKGISFVSDIALPHWAEICVEMQLPRLGAGERERVICCHAVVVQCARRARGRGYEVTLWFSQVPKRAQSALNILPAALNPLSISITS
jgi:hypothetical protein